MQSREARASTISICVSCSRAGSNRGSEFRLPCFVYLYKEQLKFHDARWIGESQPCMMFIFRLCQIDVCSFITSSSPSPSRGVVKFIGECFIVYVAVEFSWSHSSCSCSSVSSLLTRSHAVLRQFLGCQSVTLCPMLASHCSNQEVPFLALMRSILPGLYVSI